MASGKCGKVVINFPIKELADDHLYLIPRVAKAGRSDQGGVIEGFWRDTTPLLRLVKKAVWQPMPPVFRWCRLQPGERQPFCLAGA